MRSRIFIPLALLYMTLPVEQSRATTLGSLRPMTAATAGAVHDVRVTHDRYTAHVQPSIAVNPRDSRNLLGTALFFHSHHGPYVGTFASFDGGRTWRDNGPLPLPRGTDSSDVPSVAFDVHGRGFVVGTAVNAAELDMGSDQHTCVCLWRTNDGGRTFGRPVAIVRGQAVDHPWIATASTPGTIYVVWRSKRPDGIAFSRSTDDGRSFSTPRLIARVPNGGAYAPMASAGRGRSVFVVYDAQANQHPGKGKQTQANQHPARVQVVTSTDGGLHFGLPKQLGSGPEVFTPVRHFTVLTAPAIAVDPRGRTVYVTYAGFHGGSAPGIVLTRSVDGGRTWSDPVPVDGGLSSTSTGAFQPAITVESAGRVDVSFFALAGGRINVWLGRSIDHGSSFGPVHRITATSFNPALGLHQGGASGSWWIGDYQGLAAGGHVIHPVWSDTLTGRLEIVTAAVQEP